MEFDRRQLDKLLSLDDESFKALAKTIAEAAKNGDALAKSIYDTCAKKLGMGLSILIVTLLPALSLCAFGIRGESISQFLFAFIKYMKKRRKLSFIHFYDGTHIDAKKLAQSEPEEEKLDEPAEETTFDSNEPNEQISEKKARTRRKLNMPDQPHILNSAMKEMLLRKLELGDDDGEYGDI